MANATVKFEVKGTDGTRQGAFEALKGLGYSVPQDAEVLLADGSPAPCRARDPGDEVDSEEAFVRLFRYRRGDTFGGRKAVDCYLKLKGASADEADRVNCEPVPGTPAQLGHAVYARVQPVGDAAIGSTRYEAFVCRVGDGHGRAIDLGSHPDFGSAARALGRLLIALGFNVIR